MGIRDENALISYKRKIKGFDVNLGSNYNLLSNIPDYGINFEFQVNSDMSKRHNN